MRRFFGLLLLPVLILPGMRAVAEETSNVGAAPQHHVRLNWEQRFNQANLAHDGHLTLDEAKGGYPLVAKHFNNIDMDGKGYVTENDLRAWRAMRKAAHLLTQPPEDGLRPRAAYQRVYPDQRPVSTSITTQLTATAGSSQASADRTVTSVPQN